MAEAFDRCEIACLPVKASDHWRRALRSSDLVFCSGSQLFSSLFPRFTRSV